MVSFEFFTCVAFGHNAVVVQVVFAMAPTANGYSVALHGEQIAGQGGLRIAVGALCVVCEEDGWVVQIAESHYYAAFVVESDDKGAEAVSFHHWLLGGLLSEVFEIIVVARHPNPYEHSRREAVQGGGERFVEENGIVVQKAHPVAGEFALGLLARGGHEQTSDGGKAHEHETARMAMRLLPSTDHSPAVFKPFVCVVQTV